MKKLGLFLITCVIVSMFSVFSAQAGDIEPIPTPTPRPEVPNITMIAPTGNVDVVAGKAASVNVTLKNIGNSTARHIKIFTPITQDFVLALPNKIYEFPLSENSTREITLNITPDKDLKAGNYSVKFDYTYENNALKEFSGSATIYLKVESSSDGSPNVVLSDFAVDSGKIVAGQSFDLDFIIKNLGIKDAKNVQLTIDNLKTGEFTTNNSSDSKYIGEVKIRDEQDASFALSASSKMKAGSYPVTLSVKYTDSADKEYTDKFTYYVNVTTREGATDGNRALVEITDITRPTGVFSVAQDAVINVTLANNGTNTAKNIKITATPAEGIVPKSANIQLINSLEPGRTQDLTFVFSPTSETKTRNYSIGFTVDYQTGELDEDDVSKTDQFMQYIGINVSNPKGDSEEDKIKSVPKIIISKYSLEPLIVQAGQEFDIDLEFQNTHSMKTVSNVTVSLSVIATETEKGSVFTPVDSSNIFYIEKIEPKGTTDQHIRMYTVPDAKPKNYIITATFKYEDEDGNNLESTAEFGVNVKQISKLEVGDIYFPEYMNVGEQQYLSFSLQNTGKVTLYNLKVKVDGPKIDNSSSEQIFGNFVSGDAQYYDASFTPIEPGETTLRLIISYDDDMGQRIERIEEYNCVINEMMMDDGMGMGMDGMMGMDGRPMEFDENGNPIDPNAPKGFAALMKNVWFWTGAGIVLAVIIVVAVVVIRKRKQRKGFDFDE